MKKSWMKYVLVGVGLYLVIVIARLPAEFVYGFAADTLKSSPAKVRLYQVSGTLWKGKAQYASVSGKTLRNISWDLHLASLFTGSLGATVNFKLDEGTVKTTVFRGLGGDLRLEDVKARVPMSEIIRLAKIPAVKLEGTLGLNFKELAMSEGILSEADGRVVWNGAESRFPQRLLLGDLSATVKNTDKGIEAVIADAGGPLEANGTLTLAPDGKYDFSGEFASREGPNSILARSLSMMGRPDPRGKVKVTNAGNLKDFGFLLN